ncbi:MAG: hypothetical protein AB9869_18915 [Verrucomicrobiia bacterium]
MTTLSCQAVRRLFCQLSLLVACGTVARGSSAGSIPTVVDPDAGTRTPPHALLQIKDTIVRPLTVKAAEPDLVPVVFTAPSNLPAGQKAPVSWEVVNRGSATAVSPWWDAIHLSRDETLDRDDLLLALVEHTLALGPG